MKTVKTTAVSAQVYRNGAEIIRKGTVKLEQGTNTVRILGLSDDADLDTASLFFPAGTGMTDIHFGDGENIDEEDSESSVLSGKIDDLKKKKEVKELQVSLWKENGVFKGSARPNLKEVEDYIIRLPERVNALNDEIADISRQMRKLEKELKEAKRRESQPYANVVLEAPQTAEYPFELHYHISNAGWMPVYEIHTDTESPVLMKSRARITQNTGEDWKDMTVSLLTSTPTDGALPELYPVYLSFRQSFQTAVRAKGMMGMNAMADTAVGDTMELSMPMAAMSRMETEEAEISSEETMTEYVLPGKKQIPSGSSGTMADLQSFEVPAEYELIAVPRKDVHAYLAAKVKTANLPADFRGNAGIYLNGVYAGEMYITPDLTKEDLRIPLGKAEGIQVSRTEKKKKTSEALLKNQRTTEYVYELKLTNNRSSDITLRVQDQIPTSQEKTIIVDIKNTDQAEKDDSGILTWLISLGAKQTKVLNLSYNISWPKDKTLRESTGPVRRFCHTCGREVPAGLRFCPECGSEV